MTQPAKVLSLDESGHIWAGSQLSQRLIKQIQEVVKLDAKSRHYKDQIKQKKLYWDLAEIMPSFKKTGTREHWWNFLHQTMKDKEHVLNPIFYFLLNTHQYVDFEDEEK